MSTPFINGKFDRRTLDATFPQHQSMLSTLRQIGRSRSRRLVNCKNTRHEECCASTAFRWLRLANSESGDIYVDLGCGDSPDGVLASRLGYKAVGVDLALPTPEYRHGEMQIILGDICERLPFEDSTVDAITIQAVASLIFEEERERVYRECYRILKPTGALAVTGPRLSHGYHYEPAEEVERAERIFDLVNRQENGFLAIK